MFSERHGYCSGTYTLLGGAIDAAILLQPSNFQLKNQGFNDFGLTMQCAPEQAFSGTMANKAWAARKISRVKLNTLIDALVSLDDLQARGNIERFRLPVVVQLSD